MCMAAAAAEITGEMYWLLQSQNRVLPLQDNKERSYNIIKFKSLQVWMSGTKNRGAENHKADGVKKSFNSIVMCVCFSVYDIFHLTFSHP